MDNNQNFVVTFNVNQLLEKPIQTEYNYLVNMSYGKIPMNVGSGIGHHITRPLPKECTYKKQK